MVIPQADRWEKSSLLQSCIVHILWHFICVYLQLILCVMDLLIIDIRFKIEWLGSIRFETYVANRKGLLLTQFVVKYLSISTVLLSRFRHWVIQCWLWFELKRFKFMIGNQIAWVWFYILIWNQLEVYDFDLKSNI